MTEPQPQIPVLIKANVVNGAQPPLVALTFVTGTNQFTFVTDPDSAEKIPALLAGVLGQVLPIARAAAAGLILPAIPPPNGHRPPTP